MSNLQMTLEKIKDPAVACLPEELYQKHVGLQACRTLQTSISQALHRLTTANPWFSKLSDLLKWAPRSEFD